MACKRAGEGHASQSIEKGDVRISTGHQPLSIRRPCQCAYRRWMLKGLLHHSTRSPYIDPPIVGTTGQPLSIRRPCQCAHSLLVLCKRPQLPGSRWDERLGSQYKWWRRGTWMKVGKSARERGIDSIAHSRA